MANVRTKSTIINTCMGIFSRIITILANLLLQTALISALGVQYTGISGLFTSVLTVLSLAELGIGNAISYALYQPLASDDNKRIAAIMNFYRTAYRLIGCIVFVLGLCLIPFLDVIIKDVPDIRESFVLIYILYILKTAVSYFLIYKSTLLIANQKNYVVLSLQAAMNVVRVIAECLVLLCLKNFILYLCVEILMVILQNLWISHVADKRYRYLRDYKKEALSKEEKRKLFSDIKGVSMYKMSHCLGEGLDNIIVSALVGTGQVGYMSNYILIKDQLLQLLNQFYNALIPSVGNMAVTSSSDDQHHLFSELLFFNFWVSCFCSISYFILIEPFISLWLSADFLLSTAIAAIVALDLFLACMLNVIASFRNANGLFVRGQYRPLVTTVMNVILSVLWGRRFGISGVLSATVVSRLVTQWYDPWLLYKNIFRTSPKAFFKEYYSYLLFTVICGGLLWKLCTLIPGDSLWVTLIARAVLCLLVPNGVIFLLYHKSPNYKACLKRFGRFFHIFPK